MEKPEESSPMEGLMQQVGDWGCFQWILVGSIKWGMMPIGWSMMQMAFAGMVPHWWCLPAPSAHQGNASWANQNPGNWSRDSLPGNGNASWANEYPGIWSRDNVTYQQCVIPQSEGESCAGHVVFDDSVSTVINEWSLVCDQSYVKGLMTSLQMVGVLLGALIGGQSSDTIGRRKTVYVTILAHTVTSLVAAFSVTWQMFLVMRVLIGVTLGLYLVSSFSFPLEFVGPQHRQIASFVPAFTTGVSIFALTAWLDPNWRHLHIGSAILGVPFLLTWFSDVVPESARWLATRGRLQEAEAVVERVARRNGRSKPADTGRAVQQVALHERRAGQGRRYTYLNVYQGWRMALTSLVCNFIWFVMAFSYYGISFGVSALSGNLYLNIFLVATVEIPTSFLSVFMSNRIGRRWTCLIFFIICALCSFSILVVNKTVSEENQGTVTTVLALGSKLAVGSGWFAVSVVTSEQYPTVIRNLGFGASNTVSRVGGALAPLLLQMDTEQDVVRAYVIIGSLMTASGLVTFALRETKGQGLQDSISIGVEKVMVKDAAGGEDQASGSPAETPVWTVNGEIKQLEREFLSASISVKL